jgi:hypothetical protein
VKKVRAGSVSRLAFFIPVSWARRGGRFRVASRRATRSIARVRARDGWKDTKGTMFSRRCRVRPVGRRIGAGLSGAHLEHGLGDETTATAGATSQP